MSYITSVTKTFTTPGEHTWEAQSLASDVTVTVIGARGQDGQSGDQLALGDLGGEVTATFGLADGTYQVGVGGQDGTHGGGAAGSTSNSTGGAGGGRSELREGSGISTALAIGAGGAGGGAATGGSTDAGAGGQGGSNTGAAGANASTGSTSATGGGGGDQSGGGTAGENATAGSQGVGGDGGSAAGDGYAAAGGGGGGYYGGGGGGGTQAKVMGTSHAAAAGGGGGSNFVDDAHADWVSTATNAQGIDATNGGDGYVELQYDQEVFDISGTITDETGTAIENATVYITRQSDNTLFETLSTDASGNYSLTGVPTGSQYHVAAQHDDGSTKYAGPSYHSIDGSS